MITLITGGARSGKSTFAENLALKSGKDVLYVATSIPFDDEMKDRVKKHKERRPSSWATFEGYKNLSKTIDFSSTNFQFILLDCVTIMVTNLMYEFGGFNIEALNGDELDKVEKKIMKEISDLIDVAKKTPKTFILVTNEIGFGVVPENKQARIFRDIAGRVNQYIASQADEVQLIVCGIPVKIK